MNAFILLILIFLLEITIISSDPYKPTWASLDTRPLPGWFDKSKIGVFITWGVFSVPSFSNEWFWNCWKKGDKNCVDFITKNYRPGWTYADFASDFTAEFYNASEWVDIFKAVGARYVVFVSKHHDGFCNWPTNYSFNWNSMAVGPKRDLVGELADAIHKESDIHLGIYHSMYEWYHPLYLQDKKNGFHTHKFPEEKTLPELYELVEKYKPDIVWSDGEWEASSDYWKSKEFIAWLYNESPVKNSVVVNDRWGNETRCKHGGFWDCSDAYDPGELQKHKWENNFPLDRRSWGYRRTINMEDIHTMKSFLKLLARTISCGGNFLVNVGPTKSGKISPIFEERLRDFGSWVKINNEAIYESFPWKKQNDSVNPNLWYVARKLNSVTNVYAFILDWPKNGKINAADMPPLSNIRVTLLGYNGTKKFVIKKRNEGGSIIQMPNLNPVEVPCKWSWVLKFENVPKYFNNKLLLKPSHNIKFKKSIKFKDFS